MRSPYRCKACDAPFRADTPTNVEVAVYCNFILSLRCPLCGGKNLTLGFNLSQAENEALRIAGTIEQRAQHWHENGEVGTSSLTIRSEENTSELQSLMRISYAVFCLKKQRTIPRISHANSSITTTNITTDNTKINIKT